MGPDIPSVVVGRVAGPAGPAGSGAAAPSGPAGLPGPTRPMPTKDTIAAMRLIVKLEGGPGASRPILRDLDEDEAARQRELVAGIPECILAIHFPRGKGAGKGGGEGGGGHDYYRAGLSELERGRLRMRATVLFGGGDRDGDGNKGNGDSEGGDA